MKRILFAVTLILALSTASFAGRYVAGGKTHTTIGDYKIEVADNPITINGQQLTTYQITYENSPMKVLVAVRNDKKCKTYIVLSDVLSVQYICNGDYFGVQILEKPLESLNKDGYATSDGALNKSEYFHQKLIVPGKQTELASTELIAAYFPMLIKDEMIATR
jgi:hypothetical protein